jgi:group II intron maturase
MTGRDQTQLAQEMVVAKLNRTLIGWANYFFHEKAGECQVFSFILSLFSFFFFFVSSFSKLFPFSQAASVATLPYRIPLETGLLIPSGSHLVHAETGNLEWAATASSLMHSNEKRRCAIPCTNRAFMDDVEASGIGSEREADSPVCWKQWKCEQQMERLE